MSVSATHPVAAIHQDLMQRDVTRAALPELGATAAVPVLAELVHDPHDSTSRIERTAISQAVRAEPGSTTNRTALNNKRGSRRPVYSDRQTTRASDLTALDDVELTRDLPDAGLTAGWSGRILHADGIDPNHCAVQFYWGPLWRGSDVWSVPYDALVKRTTPLTQLAERRRTIPWLRDQ